MLPSADKCMLSIQTIYWAVGGADFYHLDPIITAIVDQMHAESRRHRLTAQTYSVSLFMSSTANK